MAEVRSAMTFHVETGQSKFWSFATSSMDQSQAAAASSRAKSQALCAKVIQPSGALGVPQFPPMSG
jgi:hypothetical protein